MKKNSRKIKSLEVALTSVDTDISKATCTKCKTTVSRGNDPKKYSKGGDPIDIKMCELALHYLTPPASSIDIERLFSTAADNTTNDRHIYISPSTLISSFKK